MKTRRRWTVGAAALVGFALTGCMTFEATLPGTLDMRKELAKPQDAPLEPARPAFGDLDDSFFEGFVMTESTDAPTSGEYINPEPAAGGEVQTPAAPKDATLYRRVMRQWFIIGLFPILADPDLVTTDLKAELSQPGSKATSLRVTSGMDLIDLGRALIAQIGGMILGIPGLLALVPTRTTEVIGYVEKTAAPAATAPPVETVPATPETPATPEGTTTPEGTAPDATPATPAAPVTPSAPSLPDAPVTSQGTGGSDASK